MKIKTTIYMQKSLLSKLEEIARLTEYSKSYLIIYLLHQLKEKKFQNYAKISCPTEYQKTNFAEEWHKFHISFSPADYENFVNMRNFFKRSLSLLLAIAINKYLMILQRKVLNEKNFSLQKFWSDNYTLNLKVKENNRVVWQVFWGFPKENEIFEER